MVWHSSVPFGGLLEVCFSLCLASTPKNVCCSTWNVSCSDSSQWNLGRSWKEEEAETPISEWTKTWAASSLAFGLYLTSILSKDVCCCTPSIVSCSTTLAKYNSHQNLNKWGERERERATDTDLVCPRAGITFPLVCAAPNSSLIANHSAMWEETYYTFIQKPWTSQK
jgi:hypothetical protein